MIIYLVQRGCTQWEAEKRMQGRLSLPLDATGQQQARAAAAAIADVKLKGIYAPADEASLETAAAAAADRKRCKVRQVEELAEVNVGLWQGMLADEIKQRQPRVYKRWQEDPLSIEPPEGESFGQAYQRVVAALIEIIGRHKPKDAVAVVAPPMVAAFVRCYLKKGSCSDIWELISLRADQPERFEVEV